MVKLSCLNSVSQWEHEQVSNYPEIGIFIDKLKEMIKTRPDAGLKDALLSAAGKNIACMKRSVNITIFSSRYAIGYSCITAFYIYNDASAVIIQMKFA